MQQPSWKSLCDLARKFTRFLRVFDLSSSGNVAGADVEVDVGVVQNFKVQQPDYYDFNSASWFCKKFPSPRLFLWFCHGTTKHESDDSVQHFYIFFLRFLFCCCCRWWHSNLCRWCSGAVISKFLYLIPNKHWCCCVTGFFGKTYHTYVFRTTALKVKIFTTVQKKFSIFINPPYRPFLKAGLNQFVWASKPLKRK